MPATTRKYPRATLKKILKGHTNKRVARDVDVLVYLNYVLFMSRLLQNAKRKSRESGEKNVRAGDIRKVTLTTLRQFRG